MFRVNEQNMIWEDFKKFQVLIWTNIQFFHNFIGARILVDKNSA